MIRRAGFLLTALLLTLAVVEVLALAALFATGLRPERSFADIYASSACMTANEFNLGEQVRSADDVEVMLGRIPHPFFGFVLNSEGGDRDWRRTVVGPTFETELRYAVSLDEDPRPAEVFTIGIFGASVAVSFAEHVMADERFADELRERIPALRDRRIVLRNMAIGASRQPSQLAIAVQYMELFDMTINLDGYSEQAISMYPRYPIEFPMFSDVFFSSAGATKYLALRASAEACAMISRPGRWPLLRHSNAYYLFWYVASDFSRRLLAEGQTYGETTEELPFSEDEVRRLYAAYYERYTRYQHQVLAANGVRAYFFLQPNQYVPSSKPFSEEERRAALGAADGDEVAKRYALLRTKVADLAEQGVAAHDLTGLFADVSETVYVDSCCHLNARGNALVAEAVLQRIAQAENGRLE